MVHQPAGAEVTPGARPHSVAPQRLETIVREAQAELEVTLPRPPLRELLVEAAEERHKYFTILQPPPGQRKEKPPTNKFALSTKAPKFVRIDRPGAGEFIGFPEPRQLPINKKEPHLNNLLNLYLVTKENEIDDGRKPTDSFQSSEKRSTAKTPPFKLSTTALPIPPLSEQMVIAEEVPQVLPVETEVVSPGSMIPGVARPPTLEKERSVEQVRAVDELLESPRKRRRLADVEPSLVKDLDYITLPSEFQSRELTGSVLTLEQAVVDSVQLWDTTVEARHQEIVNKILVSGRLTLEDLCLKPVSRLNIARAFGDVLVLSRHGYVMLATEEMTTELKFVERGPKMGHLI
nr:PREDICTED: uncharacterized protein LOC103314457 [Tribolium castaneum]|eukprot:XP_015839543.1 PREDICTED: uncharacterized protein LOC103314457 [Tribolium castaneum]